MCPFLHIAMRGTDTMEWINGGMCMGVYAGVVWVGVRFVKKMFKLTVASLKVWGIKQPLKRAAVFLSLESVQFDLIFLQECHFSLDREGDLFSKGWALGPSVWGAGEGKGDGLGVLFKSFDWELEAVLSVVLGRIICVDGTGRGIKFRAIGVYAPCRVGQRQGILPFVGASPLHE